MPLADCQSLLADRFGPPPAITSQSSPAPSARHTPEPDPFDADLYATRTGALEPNPLPARPAPTPSPAPRPAPPQPLPPPPPPRRPLTLLQQFHADVTSLAAPGNPVWQAWSATTRAAWARQALDLARAESLDLPTHAAGWLLSWARKFHPYLTPGHPYPAPGQHRAAVTTGRHLAPLPPPPVARPAR